MSYQVLARKWRPQSFQEIVGQSIVVRTLINALDQQRLHHAYLFTGTRGVGKTTLARILAKCFNCEQGVTSQPCNQCATCQAITQGKFFDLFEIDAASRTKVEDTRDLLYDVQCAPTQGRYKIYIIDEVHMLSNHSFNALLKTLEEPPQHAKFFLATTDPQRLPLTILSRCLQFQLKNLSSAQISKHLSTILEQEQIDYDSDALHYLSQAAQGSVRDALSLLDQAIAYGNGQVRTAEVKALLGATELDLLTDLLLALANKNGHQLIQLIGKLADSGTDFAAALEDLLALIHQIAVQQAVPDLCTDVISTKDITKTTDTISTTDVIPSAARDLANTLSAEEVQLYYQIGIMGRRDLPLAPTPRSGFEMIMLRMLAFRPQALPATRSEESTKYYNTAQVENTAPTAPLQKPVLQKPALQKEDRQDHWQQLLSQLNLQGVAYVLASHCVQTKQNIEEIELLLDSAHAALLNKTAEQRIEAALQAYLQHPIRLQIKIGSSQQITPALLDKAQQEKQQSEAVKAITEDDHVRTFINQFNAQIIPNSIKIRNDEASKL